MQKPQHKSKIDSRLRTCIVSREKFHKSDLLRIVSFRGEDIQIDTTGKKEGRGCYVSLDFQNLEALIAKNGSLLARTLKKKISSSEIEYLKTEFAKAVEYKQFRPRENKPTVLKVDKKTFSSVTANEIS